ncbi:MAG TPA: polymer-forming cytoskeletal protein [Terriglobales bacterium]|nr:polymer-forming cytoskeletal protein [Terriglobales bacterium]
MIWGPIALTAATSALIGASLAPAINELCKRRDAAPLPTRIDDGHITTFAESFRKRLAPFTAEIQRCAERRTNGVIVFPDCTRGLLIGVGELPSQIAEDVSALVLCGDSNAIPRETELRCDVLAYSDLRSEAAATLRALLIAGDGWLGERCVVCRWLHCDGTLSVASGSTLYGRASAAREIRLSPLCRFARLHAPAIRFGDAETRPVPGRVFPMRSIVDVKLGRLLATGDFHLASGDVLQGHVVASGNVMIDRGSRILGSVKSHGRSEIGPDTEIHGSMVSSASLHLAGSSFLRGPVLAESELYIGPNTIIGSPESPTTVSAPRVRIAPGCIIHGSVWARYEGRVEATAASNQFERAIA